MNVKLNMLFIAIVAAMLTGCGGGGSFAVSTVEKGSSTLLNPPKQDSFDVVQPPASGGADVGAEKPVEYGFALYSPVIGGMIPDGNMSEYGNVNLAKAQIDEQENFDTLTLLHKPFENRTNTQRQQTYTITADGFARNTVYAGKPGLVNKDSDIIDENLHFVVNAKNDGDLKKYDTLKMLSFDNVKMGSVMPGDYNFTYANLFYKAKNPSLVLPTQGVAHYHGAWDVARSVIGDVDEVKYGGEVIGYKAANSSNLASAKFSVDFGKKTIDGTFTKHRANKQDFGYTLKGAKITGNRFSGTAQPLTELTDRQLKDAQVSGGFFGEQGSELAGRLSNQDMFGVFAAKQTSSENLVEGKLKSLSLSETITSTPLADGQTVAFTQDFVQTQPTHQALGNLNKITLNGVNIDLMEASKNTANNKVFGLGNNALPLVFVQAGGLIMGDAQDATVNYFYQGQLTQDMPTTGSARYKGNWIGFGRATNGVSYSMGLKQDATARFVANFADKTLSGQFFSGSGAEVMTMDKAVISNNTFNGTAKITSGGLSNDSAGITSANSKITGTVNVSGGFFGTKANEIGGKFIKDDKSFAGVFAGKKLQD